MLGKATNMTERFELAHAVITTMYELHEAFPTLVFPDVKPSNFLVVTTTSGGRAAPRTVVLTDLGSVRKEGTAVALSTWPYAHRECVNGAPSRHAFERYATLIVLLQIMLGQPSEGEVEQWGRPSGKTLQEKYSGLRDEPAFDNDLKQALVPDLINLFRPLDQMLVSLTTYQTIKSSLE